MSLKDWYQRLRFAVVAPGIRRRFEQERRHGKPLAEIMSEHVQASRYDQPVEKTTRQDVTDFAKVLASSIFDDSQNLAGGLLKTLTTESDWPFDLGQGEANYEELLIVDFWAMSYAFTSTSSNSPATLKTEKIKLRDAFLHEFQHKVFSNLLAVGFSPSEVEKFSDLANMRFGTYYEEWDKWEHAIREDGAYFGFARAVTKNVFGAETKSFMASFLILARIQSYLLATRGFMVGFKLHDRIAYGLLESEARH